MYDCVKLIAGRAVLGWGQVFNNGDIMAKQGARVWWHDPLILLGSVVVAQAMITFNVDAWRGAFFLIVMAYAQSISYGLLARAGTRSSNVYHLLTALLSSLVFFATFRYLILEGMPFLLFPAYVYGTVLGSVHGSRASQKIELWLGLKTEKPKDASQLARFWPSAAILVGVLFLQVQMFSSYGIWVLGLLALCSLADNFSFALLRLARSSDHYWFHGWTAAAHIGVSFVRLAIMTRYRMAWELFIPITAGTVVGGLLGANYARVLADRVGARFDAHVTRSRAPHIPWTQVGVFSLGLFVHSIVFGFEEWWPLTLLLIYACAQSASFAVVSRARQRNHDRYLAWTAVFSNAIWYLTMHQLTLGNVNALEAAPYMVGSIVGSLGGQYVAMRIEQYLQARMDTIS